MLGKSLLRTVRDNSTQAFRRRGLTTTPEISTRSFPLQVGGLLYQEGDRVIVINKDGHKVKSRLTGPLRPEGITRTGLHTYEIKHDDIIGKPAGRLYVDAPSTSSKHKGTTFRVKHPSLDQFVALAPRTVTPIYSSYGATIVSSLDIHVAPPLPINDPQSSKLRPFEILEAGTGNGGLTLHLARAIAAANPAPPFFENEQSDEEIEQGWRQWRSKRRAVVHTVEFQTSRSKAAEKLIRSFRGALYWPQIDFHSGDVGAWVKEEHERRREAGTGTDGFLDIVILDLPNVHSQIQPVIDAIKEDGQLAVWVPQITQVAACQQQIEHLGLPLKLDQVLELGEGISNGRRWDLRFVRTREEQVKNQKEPATEDSDSTTSGPVECTEEEEQRVVIEPKVSRSPATFPTMVCRPIVGELIMGGGFIGLWRKVPKVRAETTET